MTDSNVIPIRNPEQECMLELYKKYRSYYWFSHVEIKDNKIIIYNKKDNLHNEQSTSYKGFNICFREAPTKFKMTFKLKET